MRSGLIYALLVSAAVAPHYLPAQQLWGTTMRGGADRGGTIYRVNADNSPFLEVMHEFSVDITARNPIGKMVLGVDGKFYGVSAKGGAHDEGTIFEFDPITESYTTLWEFEAPDVLPSGGLVQASNGKLYGLCNVGGTSGSGVIYSFDIATRTFARTFSFTSPNTQGATPSGELIEGSPGKLYGVNTDGGGPGGIGVLFEYDLNISMYTNLHTFTNAGGTHPTGGVTKGVDGKLYGITISNGASARGTLYSFDLATGTFAEVHDFKNQDKARPSSSPIAHSNGKIYGVATGDNKSNTSDTDAVVYEYDPSPSGTGFQLKVRFNNGTNDPGITSLSGPCEAANGKLYILTDAAGANVIEYDPLPGTATAKLTSLPASIGTRGTNSFVTGPAGELYATFPEGGSTGTGTVVKYSPSANETTKVIDMGSSTSGAYPFGDLVKANNGKLYGMTSIGGDNGFGIIFEIDPVTGTFTKKYDFDGANGGTPLGGMILASNGKLYGTTTFGGPSAEERSYQAAPLGHIAGARGHGVLFEFDPAASTYTKKQIFTPTLGTNPYGKLVAASNGKLYGVTSKDGTHGGGTLFEYVINGVITKRYDFALPATAVDNNTGPTCQLAELNGKLYGTTPYLGSDGGGTLFEFTIATNTLATLASFSANANHTAASLGSNPLGGVVVFNSKLYGVTFNGGVNAISSGLGGTLYEYTPGATAIIKKLDLPGDALAPLSSLVEQDGKLYGTFTYSANSNGGLFQYDPLTNAFTKKIDFNGVNGASPQWGGLTVVISKLGQVINFPQPDEQEFQVTPTSSPFISIPTTSSAGLPVTYTSSNPSVAHIMVAGRITQVGVGATVITATQAGNANYDAVVVQRIVTIVKGHQTINWTPPPMTPKLSQGTVALLATTTSGLPVTYTSSQPAIATIEGNVMILKKAGNVVITASQAGTNNYLVAANILMPFAIQRGDQSIIFSTIAAKEVSDATFTLDATATSQLPVSYSSSVVAVATVNGSTVTIIAPGTTLITASQVGNSDWNPATSVARSLVVNKLSQTITFEAPDAHTLGAGSFAATASATSGLTVAFTTTTPDRITIAGSTITMTTAGLASLTARQAGNTVYKEATPLTQTFCVNPAKPVITATLNNAGNLVLSTPMTGALQWYVNGVAINQATEPTHTAAAPGGYTVVADVQGCKSAPSDVLQVIVTGVMSEGGTTISLYPNPATDKLYISIPNNNGSRVSIIGMEGRLMESILTSDVEVTVAVDSYPPGMYLLKVEGEVRRFYKR